MLNFTDFGTDTLPPLVLVHGLYGSGRNWNVIAKRLSDAFRVFTVDLRNHGFSPWSDSHRYEDLAEDLADFIDHIGGPVSVMGHSMGGKAVMTLALSRAELIDALIVADIAPVSYSHSQVQYVHAMKAVDLNAVERRSEAETQLAALGVEPALCSFFTQSLDIAGKRWRLNLDTLEAKMPNILSFPEISGRFEGRTLFLSGSESDYVAPEHRPRIRTLFPNARFAKLKNAGHWLHADKPREFEAALRGFLAR